VLTKAAWVYFRHAANVLRQRRVRDTAGGDADNEGPGSLSRRVSGVLPVGGAGVGGAIYQ